MGGYALFFALVVLAPDVLEAPALARQVLGPPRARAFGVRRPCLGQQLLPVAGPLAGVLQVAGGRRALVASVFPRERSKKSSPSASRLRFWSSSSPDVVANVAHSCGRARGGRAATNPSDAARRVARLHPARGRAAANPIDAPRRAASAAAAP